jgi:hypothetical protein
MSRREGRFKPPRRYLSSGEKVKVENWKSATGTQPEETASQVQSINNVLQKA